MHLFAPGETKQECVEACPTYALCKKIALNGMAARLQAGAVLYPSGAEFEDEITGEKLTAAEFFGVSDMSHEAAALLLEGSRLIEKSASTFRDLLAESGCDGPREIGEGIVICTGDRGVKEAISETHDDVFYDPEH